MLPQNANVNAFRSEPFQFSSACWLLQLLHFMPRNEWKAINLADGWIKINQRSPSPLEQWPRLQKQVAGNGGDNVECTPNAQLPNKVRTLETAIAALGPVKAERQWSVRRSFQFLGRTRISHPMSLLRRPKRNSEQRFEVGGRSTGRDATVDRARLSRLKEAPRQQPEPGVTELEQRIQALVRECDAL